MLCKRGTEETCLYLFFECPFSSDCWSSASIHWDLTLKPRDMLIEARIAFGSCIFIEIMITPYWVIWTIRNGALFDNSTPNMQVLESKLRRRTGPGLYQGQAKVERSSVEGEFYIALVFLFSFWLFEPCNLCFLYILSVHTFFCIYAKI